MSGFFSKIFGGANKKKDGPAGDESLIETTVQGIIERANFDLKFNLLP